VYWQSNFTSYVEHDEKKRGPTNLEEAEAGLAAVEAALRDLQVNQLQPEQIRRLLRRQRRLSRRLEELITPSSEDQVEDDENETDSHVKTGYVYGRSVSGKNERHFQKCRLSY